MAVPIRLFHAAQACLAAYTGLLSYTSITKLHQYESMSEKAAQYSNIAADQLHTTRTTQGSGAVAFISSLICSIVLASRSNPSSAETAPTTSSWVIPLAVSGVLFVGLRMAHSHISGFWRNKAKLPAPGAGEYNDAITTSNQMRQALGALSITWAVSGLWYGVTGVF